MTETTGGAMLRLLDMLPEAARRAMVGMYRDTLSSQLAQLGRELEEGQVDSATSLAHKIAGSAAMMQDQPLSQSAREVERALRAGDAALAQAHWPRVQVSASLTLATLQEAYPAG
jgi:HPt (histidine-containing phosphotransfer) domain-containing protein